MDIESIKREYLNKVLHASLQNNTCSTVVIKASFSLDDIRPIIEDILKDYDVKRVIFLDYDFDDIEAFFKTKPSESEIKEYIHIHKDIPGDIRVIYFVNDSTDLSEKNIDKDFIKYEKYNKQYNGDLINKVKSAPFDRVSVLTCPNERWAKCLLGNKKKLADLWVKINDLVLDPKAELEETKARLERMKELNSMNIHNLSFYTNLGTDFRISLNRHSLWVTEPEEKNGSYNSFNYPSYEIFTAPNCYSAEGKIVLSRKKRFYYNQMVSRASFEFEKGKVTKVKSNNSYFARTVKNELYRLNRIGEIALVPNTSPIAKTNEFYDSILLDENAGCHFALGHVLDDCIGIPKEKLKKRGKSYYKYSTSKYHVDLVFGNESVCVEAETRNKKKVLLMENGNWKI